MKAMLLDKIVNVEKGGSPLRLGDVDVPNLADGEVLIRVKACGVCHTDLDEVEGRTPPHRFPAILGHQVVGEVVTTGYDVHRWQPADRVGVAWIGYSCGECEFCTSGHENLCSEFQATGRDRNGGYAEYMTARSECVFSIPPNYTDSQAAPLLCAGAIGYRSLRLTELHDGQRLGLMGYGASAQQVMMLAKHLLPKSEVMAFARDKIGQALAIEHGASWAGGITDRPPKQLDAIIDTTPVWYTVLAALEYLRPGGKLVINAIRKEDRDKEALLQLDYAKHLWLEKHVKSVANVTKADVADYLQFASRFRVASEVEEYPLCDANRALERLKFAPVIGPKVLVVP